MRPDTNISSLGIHVSSEEVLRLRSVAEKAAKKKHSIIFLPCHRSHVDYVSLQLIFYRLGIALPTVVAGDNLNFPVVGSFVQHAGMPCFPSYLSDQDIAYLRDTLVYSATQQWPLLFEMYTDKRTPLTLE